VAHEPRDTWDKADVILKPVGGLLTALAVAWIGYSVNLQQASDTNVRLYAELLGRREEADTNLRREMFNTAIRSFGETAPVTLDKRLFDLEMLAYNFHESIDLGPIFRDVYTRLLDAETPTADRDRFRSRVERVAREVIDREIATLEVHGKLDADDLFLDELPGDGKVVIDARLPREGALRSSPEASTPRRDFKLKVLRVIKERREMRVYLTVRKPGVTGGIESKSGTEEIQQTFWVGFADFPMIDSLRLPDGYRCAIVLRSVDDVLARISLLYFPTSRAALKDKPYYDEMMEDLLRARRRVTVQR
jgi:hypothetical protein